MTCPKTNTQLTSKINVLNVAVSCTLCSVVGRSADASSYESSLIAGVVNSWDYVCRMSCPTDRKITNACVRFVSSRDRQITRLWTNTKNALMLRLWTSATHSWEKWAVTAPQGNKQRDQHTPLRQNLSLRPHILEVLCGNPRLRQETLSVPTLQRRGFSDWAPFQPSSAVWFSIRRESQNSSVRVRFDYGLQVVVKCRCGHQSSDVRIRRCNPSPDVPALMNESHHGVVFEARCWNGMTCNCNPKQSL